MQTATLGGGCFWCLEALFEQIQGVIQVESGFSGGDGPADYHLVCSGSTAHAEVVQVTFDPGVLSYADVLRIFFSAHDPTTLNRQGNDVGTQYRSVIFVHDTDQAETAERVRAEVDRADIWDGPVVTEIAEFKSFHKAGTEHQEYFRNNTQNPYCQAVILPKVAKFRSQFKDRIKPEFR